jgi:hypothetical protein
MRRWLVILFLSTFALAQAPQSPRQALIEMIRASSPAMVDKHTPEVLLQAMAKLPPDQRKTRDQSMLFFSMMMTMSGNAFQTFETGPTFAIVRNPKDNSKVEITMERDDLAGDVDTMEFGIRITKDGKPQDLPMDPRILIDMKMEKNVWKLSRIGGSASIQLDDPKVAELMIKRIQEQTAARSAALTANKHTSGTITVMGDAISSSMIASLRKLNQAEVTYAATYPQAGYACRLSDLGGSLSGKSADEHGAQLIDPALEAGTRNGYRFEISGCSGTSSYRILAQPSQNGVNRRSYCTDQSGVIRSASPGEDCFASGTPAN